MEPCLLFLLVHLRHTGNLRRHVLRSGLPSAVHRGTAQPKVFRQRGVTLRVHHRVTMFGNRVHLFRNTISRNRAITMTRKLNTRGVTIFRYRPLEVPTRVFSLRNKIARNRVLNIPGNILNIWREIFRRRIPNVLGKVLANRIRAIGVPLLTFGRRVRHIGIAIHRVRETAAPTGLQ